MNTSVTVSLVLCLSRFILDFLLLNLILNTVWVMYVGSSQVSGLYKMKSSVEDHSNRQFIIKKGHNHISTHLLHAGFCVNSLLYDDKKEPNNITLPRQLVISQKRICDYRLILLKLIGL